MLPFFNCIALCVRRQNSAFCLGALAHRLPAVVAPNFNAFLSALAPLLALPAQVLLRHRFR